MNQRWDVLELLEKTCIFVCKSVIFELVSQLFTNTVAPSADLVIDYLDVLLAYV